MLMKTAFGKTDEEHLFTDALDELALHAILSDYTLEEPRTAVVGTQEIVVAHQADDIAAASRSIFRQSVILGITLFSNIFCSASRSLQKAPRSNSKVHNQKSNQ